MTSTERKSKRRAVATETKAAAATAPVAAQATTTVDRWSRVPTGPLSVIMRGLRLNEFAASIRVCKPWNRMYAMPSVWPRNIDLPWSPNGGIDMYPRFGAGLRLQPHVMSGGLFVLLQNADVVSSAALRTVIVGSGEILRHDIVDERFEAAMQAPSGDVRAQQTVVHSDSVDSWTRGHFQRVRDMPPQTTLFQHAREVWMLGTSTPVPRCVVRGLWKGAVEKLVVSTTFLNSLRLVHTYATDYGIDALRQDDKYLPCNIDATASRASTDMKNLRHVSVLLNHHDGYVVSEAAKLAELIDDNHGRRHPDIAYDPTAPDNTRHLPAMRDLDVLSLHLFSVQPSWYELATFLFHIAARRLDIWSPLRGLTAREDLVDLNITAIRGCFRELRLFNGVQLLEIMPPQLRDSVRVLHLSMTTAQVDAFGAPGNDDGDLFYAIAYHEFYMIVAAIYEMTTAELIELHVHGASLVHAISHVASAMMQSAQPVTAIPDSVRVHAYALAAETDRGDPHTGPFGAPLTLSSLCASVAKEAALIAKARESALRNKWTWHPAEEGRFVVD